MVPPRGYDTRARETLDPLLAIAHRHVGTVPQLAAYTRRREGMLWRDPEAFDAPVYYLSFYGPQGRMHTALARLGLRLFSAASGQLPAR